jgi:hypothetical protein
MSRTGLDWTQFVAAALLLIGLSLDLGVCSWFLFGSHDEQLCLYKGQPGRSQHVLFYERNSHTPPKAPYDPRT